MGDAVWNDRYLVGHPVLDVQHKECIEAMCELFATLRDGYGCHQMQECVQRLRDCTAGHIADEEFAMEMCGFPGIVSHRREHHRLLGELDELAARVCSGRAIITFESLRSLGDQQEAHMFMEDQRYRSFLTGMDMVLPSVAARGNASESVSY